MRPMYKPVNAQKKARDLTKDFKTLQKTEPGPERAVELAEFAKRAHEERSLNMVMHTAALCLEEDPDAPALLIAAYTDGIDDPIERLRAWADLEDLARYIEQPDIRELARERIRSESADWYAAAADDAAEQRTRWRELARIFDRDFADTIRLSAG